MGSVTARMTRRAIAVMSPVIRHVLATVALGLASSMAHGHHSPAQFDLASTVTLDATVTAFEWANPHVFVQIDTLDGDKRRSLQIEVDGPSTLVPLGWSRDSLKPGDRIKVEAHPPRDAARRSFLGRSITKADGTVLIPRVVLVRAPVEPSSSTAEGLAGVWLPRREDYAALVAATNGNAWQLTASAQRQKVAYDGVQTPQSECKPVSAPAIMLYPVHTEVVVLPDRVLLKTDWMDVERVVFTDGREHPEDGERTIQGHTTGRWDGDALELDTRLFTQHILGTNGRIPSGRQKHVVERLSPSEDRKSVVYEYRVEDPEFLLEPISGRATWDYKPDLTPSGLPCDLSFARRPFIE